MFHDFDEVCRHEDRCDKYPPIVVSGKRYGGRSGGGGGCAGTVSKPAAGSAMEVTDTINDYEIFTTVSDRQHTEMGRSRDGGNTKITYVVRNFGLLLSKLLLLDSTIFFHSPRKLRSK